MKEIEPEVIEQEVLNHIPDPLAKLVWKKCIAEEKAPLIMPNREVWTCNPHR